MVRQDLGANYSSIYLPSSFDRSERLVSRKRDLMAAQLARKKNRVMELVSSIRKTGYNDFSGYSFVEEAEVVRILRSALIEAGLSISVSVSQIMARQVIKTEFGEQCSYTVKMLFTLVDTETGYCETYPWLTMGADSADKALNKAYTSGVKYFLLKNFLLPTDDDVENVSVAGQGGSNIISGQSYEERPAMDENSARIMKKLAGFYRQRTPAGARFDEERLRAAVWDYFHRWPDVNAAAERIKQVIDPRETVVWVQGTG